MNLTALVHKKLADFFENRPLNFAVDATVGRGRDALFLYKLLSDTGTVFGFDIQESALEESDRLLESYISENNSTAQKKFFLKSHSEMLETLPVESIGKIGAICFNLGWLPLSDHSISTNSSTTLEALEQSLKVMERGNSVLSVLSYRGHTGGYEEFEVVRNFFSNNLEETEIFGDVDNSLSPILFFAKF